MLRQRFQPLFSAIGFLTLLPVPLNSGAQTSALGESLLWYPIVGLLMGGFLVLGAMTFNSLLPSNELLFGVLLLALWVLITGGLHLDGIADCADAWLGGHGDREKTLRIMKDPNSGSMAVIALILLLAIKGSALVALWDAGEIAAVWAVPVWARLSVLPLFLWVPYVRQHSYAAELVEQLPRSKALTTLIVVPLVLCVFLPAALWFASVLAFVSVFALVRYLTNRRLGGFTGDVAGAQIELQEMAALLVLVFMLLDAAH